MSAIEAITKSSSGAGQAMGKSGAPASNSFDQLFALSTDLPPQGQAALGEGEADSLPGAIAMYDAQPDTEDGAPNADLDAMFGFPILPAADITGAAAWAVAEDLVETGDVSFALPGLGIPPTVTAPASEQRDIAVNVVAPPSPALQGQDALAPPREGLAFSDVAGTTATMDPDPVAKPLVPMTDMLVPDGKEELGHAEEQALASAAGAAQLVAPAMMAPVQMDEAVDPAFGDPAAPSPAAMVAAELASRVQAEKKVVAPRTAMKGQPIDPVLAEPATSLPVDAASFETSADQTRIVARVKIQPSGPSPLGEAATTPILTNTAEPGSAQTQSVDLPEIVFEQPAATLPTVRGHAGPTASAMANATTPEPGGSVAQLPLSTAPATELMRLTLDTRDATWRDRLVTQLVGDTRGGTQSLTISLRPKSLGDIQLSVDMSGGAATVRIVAETTSATRMIMANEDLLSSLMEQAGIRLSGISVQHATGAAWMGHAASQIVAQTAVSSAARDATTLRKDRTRGSEMRAVPETNLKLGDSSQLGINLLA